MVAFFKFQPLIKIVLSVLISVVWLVNGLFCKVLNFVPRHQLIVAGILGEEHAVILTKAIGISEILMVIWILSGIKSRLCTLSQICIVGVMNIIEFIVVPDMLLFGRMNSVFAACFIGIVFINEFYISNIKVKESY